MVKLLVDVATISGFTYVSKNINLFYLVIDNEIKELKTYCGPNQRRRVPPETEKQYATSSRQRGVESQQTLHS